MKTKANHILLVEDDEDDRLFFQEVLDDLGNPVILQTAEHGLEAIQLLEENSTYRPHAIFLDLNMSVMDGEETLKKIRSNSRYDDIKIIIFSTSYNPFIAKELENEGANYYIQKPSNYISLLEVIKTTLHVINGSVKSNNFLISIK